MAFFFFNRSPPHPTPPQPLLLKFAPYYGLLIKSNNKLQQEVAWTVYPEKAAPATQLENQLHNQKRSRASMRCQSSLPALQARLRESCTNR